MPTIKTKKEMNLPQLIEWATSNDITNTFAKLKSRWPLKQGIRINNDGRLRLVEMQYLSKNNIFTVEVEEEITEDTVFKHMIEVRGSDHTTWNNTSIADEKLPNSTQFYAYIDEEYKLIWRDGKLVE